MHPLLQYITPHHLVTKIAYWFADSQIKWLKNFLIKIFIGYFKVELQEAKQQDPRSYSSFNEFFTRKLQINSRPIIADDNIIVSAADGTISQFGNISNNLLIQAKNKNFSVADLLAKDVDYFQDGTFMTIYLSPKDYHRIHMPISAKLQQMTYIPGRLFSVNNNTANAVDKLFARNERVVCIFDTDLGKMAMILVGAMIVGSIETIWHGSVTPPHEKTINTWSYSSEDPDSYIHLKKGEEMGLFQLGSTVIMLFEKDKIQWNTNLSINSPVKMGQELASVLSNT